MFVVQMFWMFGIFCDAAHLDVPIYILDFDVGKPAENLVYYGVLVYTHEWVLFPNIYCINLYKHITNIL